MIDPSWQQRAREYVRRRVIDRTSCWTTGLRLDRHGYARSTFEYRHWFIHRLSYEAYVGPIPDGMVIDHICRNRACVRPDHLEPVTVWENTRRSDNFMAHRAASSTCGKAHPFDDANTRMRGNRRQCRACNRSSDG